MAAFHRTLTHRAWFATLVAAALVCDVSPSSAADIVGTPRNAANAAVQITACSVSIDPENANAYPDVTLAAVPGTPSQPVSAQVELGLHDALGAGDETRVLVVTVEKSKIPLSSYPVNGNYNGLGCHLRTITFADGSVQSVSFPKEGGGGSGGAALGIIGGVVLVGGIAAAAGHGGSSGGGPATVQPTITPIPITPSASPTPRPTATPVPVTPTPTVPPTATPVPTPTASPTAGSLVVTPQTLTFIATGTAYAKTTQASESNYRGSFMASPASCLDSNGTGNNGSVSTVASISPASTTSGLFTVTPLGPGTCTFAITDVFGDQQIVSVGVTTTGGTIQGRKRHAQSAAPGTLRVERPLALPSLGAPPPPAVLRPSLGARPDAGPRPTPSATPTAVPTRTSLPLRGAPRSIVLPHR